MSFVVYAVTVDGKERKVGRVVRHPAGGYTWHDCVMDITSHRRYKDRRVAAAAFARMMSRGFAVKYEVRSTGSDAS